MKEASDILRLGAELAADARLLEDLLAKNRRATERAILEGTDEFAWAAVGYTIHNTYCLFENYFLRIAKFFENGLDPAAWHSQLVARMTLDIQALRPALFDQAFAARIDEFRRFRQAFRNLYQTELDPARVKKLNESLPTLVLDFQPFHARFIAALEYLAKKVGE